MLKKIMIGGGLSLCLFLGVILYHHKECSFAHKLRKPCT